MAETSFGDPVPYAETTVPEGQIYKDTVEGEDVYTLELAKSWTVTSDFMFPDDIELKDKGKEKHVDVITSADGDIEIGDGSDSVTFTVGSDVVFSDVEIIVEDGSAMQVDQGVTMTIDDLKMRLYGGSTFDNLGTFVNTNGACIYCGGTFNSCEDGSEYIDDNVKMKMTSNSIEVQSNSVLNIKNGTNVTMMSDDGSTITIEDSTIGLLEFSKYDGDGLSLTLDNCSIGDDRDMYEHGDLVSKNRGGTVIFHSYKENVTAEFNIVDTVLSNLVVLSENGNATCKVYGESSVMGAIVTYQYDEEEGCELTGKLVFDGECKFSHSVFTAPEWSYVYMIAGKTDMKTDGVTISKDNLVLVSRGVGDASYIATWQDILGISSEEMKEITAEGEDVPLAKDSKIQEGKVAIITEIDQDWDKKLYFQAGESMKHDIAVFHFTDDAEPRNAEFFVKSVGNEWHISAVNTDLEQFKITLPGIDLSKYKIEPEDAGAKIVDGKIELTNPDVEFTLVNESGIEIAVDWDESMGEVTVDGQPIVKSGTTVKIENNVIVIGEGKNKLTISPKAYTGYRFDKWEWEDGSLIKNGDVVDESHHNITAVFEADEPGPSPGPEPEPIVIESYEISYDVAGGTEPVPGSMRMEKGSTMTVAPYIGYKDGSTFGGWSCNGKTYQAGDEFTVNSDMKFTAIWNAVPGPSPEPSGNDNTGIIVGIVVAVVVAVALVGGAAYFLRKK